MGEGPGFAGIGHNGGPSLEAGFGFRKLAWTKARHALLPSLPLEVVRLRVARAKRLGLPYQTYATIRATSGHDIVAFLFSGNALDLRPGAVALDAAVAQRLADLAGQADRVAAIYAPTDPASIEAAHPGLFAAVGRAPGFTASWRETRDGLRALLAARRLPRDGVVLVSATEIERGWTGAAGLAGSIDRATFFAPPTVA
ncbi:hypothetical protein LSUCC0031_11370 [Rhodobacterales bacterium LSUCC0031]|nr:hypothetical protein [Rhodobacterales bacterium LSUCC0031]